MSAVSAIHEQHAAAKQRLTVVRDETAASISTHKDATKQRTEQLAEMKAAYLAHSTATARGLEPKQDLPDATVMAKLEADLAVSEPLLLLLKAELAKREEALKKTEKEHRAAIKVYLVSSAVTPARVEVEEAFDVLANKLVRLMAASELAYHVYDDRAPYPRNYDDRFGPAAHFIRALQGIPWENWPYSIRPNWLPAHGQFFPGEMAGVFKRTEELIVEVEQVPS